MVAKHQQHASLDERHRMTDRERDDVVPIANEQRITQLVVSRENDLPRVIVPGNHLLQHLPALPERQFALVRIEPPWSRRQ